MKKEIDMKEQSNESTASGNFNISADNKVAKSLRSRRAFLSRIRRRFLRHVWVARALLLVGVFFAIYAFILATGVLLRNTRAGYYVNLTRNFIFTPKDGIESIGQRTNLIILGKGGGVHEAPDLTDTIVFVSIAHDDPSITLISIPRDIWVPSIRAKINSAYYWGEQKENGGGMILSKSLVEEVVGAPVNYAVVADFSVFKDVVDVLGGIEVDVERGFVDEHYPILGREDDECDGDLEYRCRYETVKFEKGVQKMDGEAALKFVRSRNARGDEGTDFARSSRQQNVITAIKDKVLSRQIMLSPKRLKELFKVFSGSIETDIDSSAQAILARRALQAKDGVVSEVLPEDLLENPPISPRYDNLYVFIPKSENWDEVHSWVECVLSRAGECSK